MSIKSTRNVNASSVMSVAYGTDTQHTVVGNVAYKSIVTRDVTKTPFMAVMYGGSWKAIGHGGTSGDFNAWCDVNGLDVEDTAKLAHAAVEEAMGSDFRNFISSVEHTVRTKLEMTGKNNLKYKHIDGFEVYADNTSAQFDDVIDAFSFVMTSAQYDEEGDVVRNAVTVEFGKEGDKIELCNHKTADETVRKFMVNYVQGIDALIARTVACFAADAGIRNYTSIHDCFRCHPADVGLLRTVIADAYKFLFIDNDLLDHLESQIGKITGFVDNNSQWVSYTRKSNFLTEEMLYSSNAYYFGK